MNEPEWLACTDPAPTPWPLRGKVSDHKLRLFAVACCRRVWHTLTDPRSRRAVEVAERYADAAATVEQEAEASAAFAALNATLTAEKAAAYAAANACSAAYHAATAVNAPSPANARNAERAGQSRLLRDLFGNPFRPPLPLAPSVLAWNDRIVVRMANAIYEERQLPSGHLDPARLAALADTLEEAGCTDAELLGHLRSTGPHLRGCWPVDLLPGKE